MFVSVVTAIASLTSMATTNLGGFGVGMMAGLIGSSMAFGWMPDPVVEADGDDDDDRLPGPPGAVPGDPAPEVRTEAAPGPAGTLREVAAPENREVGVPKAHEDRVRSGGRRRPSRGTALFVVSALVAAAGLPAAGTAAAAPGTNVFPLPWPTLAWPWEPAPPPPPPLPPWAAPAQRPFLPLRPHHGPPGKRTAAAPRTRTAASERSGPGTSTRRRLPGPGPPTPNGPWRRPG
ncbi:DUF6114 domain-containing protein [Streptomyces sp. BF23-18]|uniref:DUF6114 domain-containing protein n=1 Tax=Streptomyces sp. BF23-18 TaxID=3240282 RepID=UPI0034E4B4FB